MFGWSNLTTIGVGIIILSMILVFIKIFRWAIIGVMTGLWILLWPFIPGWWDKGQNYQIGLLVAAVIYLFLIFMRWKKK